MNLKYLEISLENKCNLFELSPKKLRKPKYLPQLPLISSTSLLTSPESVYKMMETLGKRNIALRTHNSNKSTVDLYRHQTTTTLTVSLSFVSVSPPAFVNIQWTTHLSHATFPPSPTVQA